MNDDLSYGLNGGAGTNDPHRSRRTPPPTTLRMATLQQESAAAWHHWAELDYVAGISEALRTQARARDEAFAARALYAAYVGGTQVP